MGIERTLTLNVTGERADIEITVAPDAQQGDYLRLSQGGDHIYVGVDQARELKAAIDTMLGEISNA